MDVRVPPSFNIPRRISADYSVHQIGMNRYRWGVIVLILASVTDLATTYIGIEYIGLVESNPAPATILAQNGWMGVIYHSLVSLGVIIGLTALLRYNQFTQYSSRLATLLVGSGGAMKLLATVWNTFLILTIV